MSFTGTLRPFQEEAYKFMLEHQRVLVAYEMGLGKTVITIATIEHLLDTNKVRSGLIIAGASLKYQWMREIHKFTDDATVLIIDGSPKERERQYSEALAGDIDYVILNYEQVVNDWEYVCHLPRDFVVCDEVTAIKSFKTKRTRRIKKLQAPYLFGLSGQPVENKPEEAFSIMQWIDDSVLGRFDLFDRTFCVRDNFGKVKRYRNLPTFRNKMAEAMVRKRRDDPDVADQLPKVTETNTLIEFDPYGARLYRRITKLLLDDLAQAMSMFSTFDLFSHYHPLAMEGSSDELRMRGQIMSKLTCLRMLCDHPELLRISARNYDGTMQGTTGVRGGSVFASEMAHNGWLDLLHPTPKMAEAVDLITEILEENDDNKIVVFSFFKPTLYLLANALQPVTNSVLFTGEMSAKARDTAKQTFQNNHGVRAFLSSDAGGYGVDLPQANYLVNYDLPWSAGKLDQRNARIVRLSSAFKAVTVINLLMRGSVEERQYAMLEQKRKIASAFVDGKGYDAKGRLNLDLATLTDFLASSTV